MESSLNGSFLLVVARLDGGVGGIELVNVQKGIPLVNLLELLEFGVRVDGLETVGIDAGRDGVDHDGPLSDLAPPLAEGHGWQSFRCWLPGWCCVRVAP